MLDASVHKTVPPELIPRYLHISDCLILSAPLRVMFDDWNNYSGLEIIVMRSIQVRNYVCAGYLVRGAIAFYYTHFVERRQQRLGAW